jgi:hypothetical protein
LTGRRSAAERFWRGYRDLYIGCTIVMIVLLPLFLAAMVVDSLEFLAVIGFGIVPVLLWLVLSRGEKKSRD